MDMNYKDLGRRIRSLRQKQHLTQEQLAEAIDMSASFLGHIERGSRVASLETLVKLCNVLDTNPGFLLAASLTCDASYIPTAMTPEVKEKLCTLLFLAHEVVMNMPTDSEADHRTLSHRE